MAAAIFKIPVSFPMQILHRDDTADASKIGNPIAWIIQSGDSKFSLIDRAIAESSGPPIRTICD